MTKVTTPAQDGSMALIKLLRGGLLTLPAKTRRKLGLKDGDYLEAVEVEEGVLLKPVEILDRAQARAELLSIITRDKWIGGEPRPSPEEQEQLIYDILAEDDTPTEHAS